MLLRICYTTLLLLYSSVLLFAQSNDYELFTTREGLPHNNVLSIVQDDYGFIWLGTYNGLCLYDGQAFKHYPEVFAEQPSSWTNVINTLFEDRQHNIWVGSWDGSISCFKRTTQGFKQYKSSIYQAKVNCFYQDSDENIWVGYENGNIGLVKDDSICTYSIYNKNIWAINQVDNNCLYMLTEECMLNYDITKKVVQKLDHYKGKMTYDVTTYNDGFYTVDDKGATKIDISNSINETTTSFLQNITGSTFFKITLSKSGNLYVTGGLTVYELTKGLKIIDSFDISQNISYSKNTIANQLIEDRSGILWLASTTGLIKIDKHKKQFSTYSTNSSTVQLTHNYVRALYTDRDNNIWVGYRSGKINKLAYNKHNGRYVLENSYSLNSTYKALTNAYVTNTLLQTKEGNILCGGEQGVFYLSKQNEFEYLLPKHYHDIVTQVWTLHEDTRGNIWIGTKDNGLYIFDRSNEVIYNYKHQSSDNNTITHNDIWKIFVDHKNRIWIGTKKGVDYVDDATDIAKLIFYHHKIDGHNIPNVWSIVEGKYRNIWLGSTSSGLYSVSEDHTKTTHVGKFKEHTVSAIVADNDNNLWVSTINGLYRFDTGSRVIFFDESEGLTSNDFNFNAATINNKGLVFLGTKSGIIAFDPPQIKERKTINSPVRISEINISGNDYSDILYDSSSFNLSWKENDIMIDLSLPDYTPYPTLFRYKLIGHDDDWIYLKKYQNRASYTNLSPGEYRFIAQARSKNEQWDHQTELDIVIHPVYWQTLWFRLCVIVLILLSLLMIIRRRFRYVLRKQRENLSWEKKLAIIELDAIRAQMNPHFLFNTINSIQGYILDDKDIQANEYLTRFARLMRLFLESSKERSVLLNEEIELIELYLSLEKLRFNDKFDYEIILNKKSGHHDYKIPSLLIQPFIENAIKHGLVHRKTKGKLQIIIGEISDNFLNVIIDDDGIGRQRSEEINAKQKRYHISRGMQMVNDRVKTFNFVEDRKVSIEIIDKMYPEQGTTVIINIPITYHNDKS